MKHMNQCTAPRKDGEPCHRDAIAGGTVCYVHGGADQAVKDEARARVEAALNPKEPNA